MTDLNFSAIDNGPCTSGLSATMVSALESAQVVDGEVSKCVHGGVATLRALKSREYVHSIAGKTAELTEKGRSFVMGRYLAGLMGQLLRLVFAAAQQAGIVRDERSQGLYRIYIDGEQEFAGRFERSLQRAAALTLMERAHSFLPVDALEPEQRAWVTAAMPKQDPIIVKITLMDNDEDRCIVHDNGPGPDAKPLTLSAAEAIADARVEQYRSEGFEAERCEMVTEFWCSGCGWLVDGGVVHDPDEHEGETSGDTRESYDGGITWAQ